MAIGCMQLQSAALNIEVICDGKGVSICMNPCNLYPDHF
jgi:hypothetical protein